MLVKIIVSNEPSRLKYKNRRNKTENKNLGLMKTN
jgi:hypothetical protein